MIRSIHYTPSRAQNQAVLRSGLTQVDIRSILEKPAGLLWVDLGSRSPDLETLLVDVFGLHPLAISDALQETHLPKVDDWGPYLYIVLHALYAEPHNEIRLETLRVDVFLTMNSLLTIHEGPLSPIERVWNTAQKDDRYLNFGPVYLLYQIGEEILNSYEPVVERLEHRIENLEARVFDRPTRDTLKRINTLKKSVLTLQRSLRPQREVFNKLAHDDYRFVDQRSRFYFRDVDDHLFRLYQITENLLERTSDLLRIYQSVVNYQLSLVVKGLTAIIAIFLPLSCIIGFFGMNFFVAAEPITSWVGRPAFVLTLLGILAFPFIVFWLLRRRGWM